MTVKQIRQQKDLTLKQVYVDVCSKPNAIAFEKDERMLAADKFRQVLANLMLSLEEFEWIDNHYQPSLANYYHYVTGTAWNSGQLQYFNKYLQQIEANHTGVQRVQLASYRLLDCYQKNNPFDEQESQLVINYFANLATWTLADIKFLANNCYVLPLEMLINLLQEAWKVQKRYAMYPHSTEIFATLLINCADRLIEEEAISSAKVVLRLCTQVTTGSTLAGYQLLFQFENAKIEYLFGNQTFGRKQLAKVGEVAEFLDIKTLVEEVNMIFLNSQ
ncbi:Rgg family transcriptional regulator [Bombilactobacillus thymidiniphilus]|uniref:HTH-type transcriptional regulator Rgg C-terminal domain-containing protein n=1 Tax=Bombilactobacillus thymidiniphilus TaxID=2923363 RepID=A0ABY4PBC3_9LACO|nr:hypothetical protein [Bombilactobacillus thymidiniphilus]UQS83068.1 hypothetical protein MOO47_04590 [Bombilactobacillus thymidiniphilus]